MECGNQQYLNITLEVLSQLAEQLGHEKIITGDGLKERYYHIWAMDKPMLAKAVILPHDTNDISNICKICNEHGQGIVIHGGLTNLVGSTITNKYELVVSLEKLNLSLIHI